MTLLRSREVVSTIEVRKSLAKTTGNGVLEPSTPTKTLEFLNQQSNSSTYNMSPLGDASDPMKFGPRSRLKSNSASASGPVRRRKVRLAAKLDAIDLSRSVENVRVSSQKRRLYSGEEEDCGDGCSSGNIKIESVDAGDSSRVLHLGMKKVRLSEQSGEVGNIELPIEKEIIVSGEDKLCGDMVSSGQRGELVEVETKVKGKRKLEVEVCLLGSVTKENEKKFLNLRSGKRILRMESHGKCLSFSAETAAVESGEVQGAESRTMRNDETLNNVIGISKIVESLQTLAVNETVDVKAVEKSTGEVGSQAGVTTRSRNSRHDKGKEKLAEDVDVKAVNKDLAEFGSQIGITTRARLSRADKGKEKFPGAVDVEAVDLDVHEVGSRSNVITRARLSRVDKGKDKLVDDGNLLEGVIVFNIANSSDTSALQGREQVSENSVMVNTEKTGYRERFRDLAKRNASRFAHFSSQGEENRVEGAGGEASPSEMDKAIEDWPGPFSTAMKIIKDRGVNMKMTQQAASLGKNKDLSVIWVPKEQLNCQRLFVPTLKDLCWPVLVKNADAITSLNFVPDVIKHKLSQLLCSSRRMNDRFLEILVCGSPAEIRVWECSWLTEEMFMRIFEGCDTQNLMVLQLDQCGCCLPDYILSGTLARSPNCLPALTTISLKGAYRLSDVGLSVLVSSAPSLRSINLSQCSLLTADGIRSLADSLGSVLRELYIDDCQGIDAMLILPALCKLQNLEVLSLASIDTVCDDFVFKFVTACGHILKELVLKYCVGLTDSSVKVIGEICSGLRAIDLSHLFKLTDAAIGYLANGCPSIQRLILCRNLFSDEAVAAYIETCGNTLKELSLNHVGKVGDNTAISLAKCSKDLVSLDLSWCRNLSNEALGLIVDSCLSLEALKLFGCTQVTNVFVNGHSNPKVQIMGLKMTSILNLKEPDSLPQGPLRYSSSSSAAL